MSAGTLPEGHPTGGRPRGDRPHLLIVEARFYDDIADQLATAVPSEAEPAEPAVPTA